MVRILLLTILLPFLGAGSAFAEPKEVCVFVSTDGKIKQVNSRSQIPVELQAKAKCFPDAKEQFLAQPDEIKLEGNVRRELMATSLGKIELRWPRKVELLFGRTPQRAMADAATTASRALKASSFPTNVQTLNLDWKVVFMDEELPDGQIPRQLVSNCHPAWMTAPANIYVVAQRVVAGCGGERSPGTKVADSQLANILLHEIGHVIEHQMLRNMHTADRMRAEGFASWFEQYSSDFSSVIKKGSIKRQYQDMARKAFLSQPVFVFRGSGSDYAQASMFFHAIADRKGVRGIRDVYDTMVSEKLGFFPAIERRLFWDEKRLMQEVRRVLGI